MKSKKWEGQSVLFKKCYELYEMVGRISHNEDNTLRKSSEITVLEILELIVIATREGISKSNTLIQTSRKIDTTKVFVNMAEDLKLISPELALEIRAKIKEVDDEVNAWKHYTSNS